MLVTSTSEMFFPSCTDLIFVFLKGCFELTVRQSIVLSQFDGGFHPEFGLAVGAVDMDMHSKFFAGEEVKPEATAPKDGWTHRRRSYH
jgi:hypothetical protein